MSPATPPRRAPRALQARADGADLVVLSELFIAGYPPEDLVLKPAFQSACRAAIEELARDTADGGPAMLIGTPWVEDGKLYNACALLDEGRIAAIRFKANLPNYGVFDEKRLFARGPAAGPVTVRGIRVGVPICEDIWLEEFDGIRKRRRMPGGNRRGNPDRAERLALCARQERFAAVDRGGPRHRKRAAADLSQPSRRPGRTGVRRRLVCAQCRPVGRGAIAGVSRKASRPCAGTGPRTAGAAPGRWRRCSRATRAITPPACSACATMSARTVFPACCSASPAASIRRCARRSRSMRWAPSASAA